MKNVLILGGTQFIGRNLVEQLLENGGYDITLFNRQLTQSNLFPSVKKIKGDRQTEDIKQIADHDWDYVVDLSCYYPSALQQALTCLKGDLSRYIFISTCSVYNNATDQSELRNEEAEILPCTHDQYSDETPESYGNRKAECERILQRTGLNHTILRPALVYGRYDHTDRFYYWLHQVKHHDELFLPDHGERKFSVTYVHDLVAVIICALAPDATGTYNVITVPQVSIRQIVDTAKDILGSNYRYVNASPEFLKEHQINQWTDMPLWIDGDHFTYSNLRLKTAFNWIPKDFEKSTRETISYYDRLGWSLPKYGMSEARRQELIEKSKNFGSPNRKNAS